MKKYILLIISAIIFLSCSDMLDIYPHSAISPGAVKDKDLPALANGMYNKVQNMPRESFILNDLVGGLVMGKLNANANDLINTITKIDDATIRSTWNGYFLALSQVNNVLSITSNMEMTPEVKKVKGAGHFFRAYIYVNLVTHWGNVPILEESTMDNIPRDQAENVWQFIERDIEKSIELLQPFTEVGNYYFVSQDAALALKARVALYRGKKAEAAQIAEDLITKGQFKLDDFEKIFRKAPNTEIIFAFENLTEESSVKMSELFYNYSHPNKGSRIYRPTMQIVTLFDDTDNRKLISWDTFGGEDCFNKYPSGQTGTDPVILFRAAELYLISAEAQGLAGINRLNELRNKRGLANISPAPATDDEYLDLILVERSKELLTEGHRYYDMIRTGRADEIGLQGYQTLLPIPESQVLVNPLLGQNEGYY